MDEFLRSYGLIAVFVGMLLEGETVLVICGFLIHQDLFTLWTVLPVALLGALAVDLGFYMAGTAAGRSSWAGHLLPSSPARPGRMTRLGERWPVFFLVRFFYGTRAPYLFYLGTRRLGWGRLLAREIPATLVWCILWIVFGHAIGAFLHLLYGRLHEVHRTWTVAALALGGTAVAVTLVLLARRKSGKDTP